MVFDESDLAKIEEMKKQVESGELVFCPPEKRTWEDNLPGCVALLLEKLGLGLFDVNPVWLFDLLVEERRWLHRNDKK